MSGHCAFPLCCSSTVGLAELKKKQIVKDVTGGGSIILASSQSIPFGIPRHLKKIPIEKWTNIDQVWLNMYDQYNYKRLYRNIKLFSTIIPYLRYFSSTISFTVAEHTIRGQMMPYVENLLQGSVHHEGVKQLEFSRSQTQVTR